jgi:hypothetical protein
MEAAMDYGQLCPLAKASSARSREEKQQPHPYLIAHLW